MIFSKFKKCPYCAERIRSEAVLCRYCGRDLILDNPIKPDPPDETTSIKGAKNTIKNTVRLGQGLIISILSIIWVFILTVIILFSVVLLNDNRDQVRIFDAEESNELYYYSDGEVCTWEEEDWFTGCRSREELIRSRNFLLYFVISNTFILLSAIILPWYLYKKYRSFILLLISISPILLVPLNLFLIFWAY